MEHCIYCMEPLGAPAKFCPVCGRAQSYDCPENHLKPGTLLAGRYLIGAAIGAGGFGITYIARDTRLNAVVAVKEYYPNGIVNRSNTTTTNVSVGTQQQGVFAKGKQKFLDEARLLASLNDEPGVVDVRDFFEENNTAYIIMEYLRGETLRDRLKQVQTIEYREAYRLLLPVMRSLKAVHAMNLIHRDISPDNIMLTQNGVKLLDFGAAREVIDEEKSLSIILKRGYAPMEQYTKKNQGPWTDVYALCATMYRCITGKAPVDALERMDDVLPTPSQLGVALPRAFEDVLMQGLALRPEQRYRSMDALIGAFEAALKAPAVHTEPLTQTDQVTLAGPSPIPPTMAAGQITQTQATFRQPQVQQMPPARPDDVTVASPQGAGQTPAKKKAKWPAVLIAVVLVAVLAGVGVWYFVGRGKSDKDGTTAADTRGSEYEATLDEEDEDAWSEVPNSVTVPSGTIRLTAPLTKYAYSTDSQSQPYVQLRSGPSGDYDVVLTIPNQALDDSNLEKAKLTVYSESVHDDAKDIDRVLCHYTYDGEDVWGWARTDYLHESKDAAAAALEKANTSNDTASDVSVTVPDVTSAGTEKTVNLNTAAGSGDDLNVRAAPYDDADIIGTVKNGSTVLMLAEQGDWSFIEYGSLQGWCMTSVARFDASPQTPEGSDLTYVKNKGVLVVGITDYAPMDYQENGSFEWVGFDADLARSFAEFLGVDVEFVEIEWSSRYGELSAKNIDCIWNAMTITDEAKSITSVSNAYCKNAQVVVVNKEVADQYQKLEDCEGLTFAVEYGSAGWVVADDNNFTYVKDIDQTTAVLEVSSGTADAAIIDLALADSILEDFPNLTYTVRCNEEEYGVGFRQGSDLTSACNSFLADAYADGTVDAIAETYGLSKEMLIK